MKEEEDELVRPQLPAFDRSSKPSVDRFVKFPQRNRDFSPVYGSYGEVGATGLKNLGNTCYMNSIIQCLLNLEAFCEYLISGGYTRHINRYTVEFSSAFSICYLCLFFALQKE